MRWRMRFGLGPLAVLFATSCGNGGTGNSTSGDLLVAYFQGGPEVGAVLLTITGGPVETVTALGGQQVSFATPLAGTTRVVIAGTLVTGEVLRLRVPDVNQSASYRVTVDQVADKTTFALINTSEHTFTVHR